LTTSSGEDVLAATPSVPVEVIGWRKDGPVPRAGDVVIEVESEDIAKRVVAARLEREKRKQLINSINDTNVRIAHEMETAAAAAEAAEAASATSATSPDAKFGKRKVTPKDSSMQQSSSSASTSPSTDTTTIKTVPFIVRADVHGSLEALVSGLEKIHNSEVRARVIASNVGAVSESDISLASTYGAVIFAFNVKPDRKLVRDAERRGIRVYDHRVIYRAMEDAKTIVEEHLAPRIVVDVLGEAEVLQLFDISVKGSSEPEKVAGCRITNGRITRSGQVQVLRGDKLLWQGSLRSFKHFKKNVNELTKGNECGINFDGFDTIEPGDKVRCVQERQVKRKLEDPPN
jgi:translation initiation factor IF-2